MSTVTITEEPLGLEALLAVVDGAQVELTGGARAAIAAGRAGRCCPLRRYAPRWPYG